MSGATIRDADTSRRTDFDHRTRRRVDANVRSGMRLTEAGQFDAMRSTCDHTQRAKHKNSRYFLVIANVVIKQLLLPQAANVTIRR
jgi:hypothetical protein